MRANVRRLFGDRERSCGLVGCGGGRRASRGHYVSQNQLHLQINWESYRVVWVALSRLLCGARMNINNDDLSPGRTSVRNPTPARVCRRLLSCSFASCLSIPMHNAINSLFASMKRFKLTRSPKSIANDVVDIIVTPKGRVVGGRCCHCSSIHLKYTKQQCKTCSAQRQR